MATTIIIYLTLAGKAAMERAGILPDRLLAAGEGAIELASTFLDDIF